MLTKTYTISCDHEPACTTPPIVHTAEALEVGGPGDARKKAVLAGWSRREGVDACPLHKGDLPARTEPTLCAGRPTTTDRS